MRIHIETDRLLLRDLGDEDVHGLFAMDSDAEVHTYLGNSPIATLAEAQHYIDFIKQQYKDYGIGRWAVVEKESGNFIGWSGFRYVTDTINAKKNYWGKGYASETAIASLNYGFKELNFEEIVGIADVAHMASNTILQKVGLLKRNEFYYDGTLHNFYSLLKTEWENSKIQQ